MTKTQQARMIGDIMGKAKKLTLTDISGRSFKKGTFGVVSGPFKIQDLVAIQKICERALKRLR